MEDKLKPNNKVDNEISEDKTKSTSEGLKEEKSLDDIKINDSNSISQNDSAFEVDIKKENATPSENNPKSQNNSATKVDIKKENVIPTENNPKSQNNSATKVDIKDGNDPPVKNIPKPKKELPVEKKPFQEFVNIHLIPSLMEEIKQRGLEINEINLQNTNRPIAGDKCWVINCEIKDTCNFWLSFEKEDISSLKSISLSKPNQKPSIIESFLIDEKRITLKLIISRVLQRLNGQKLIGVN